MKTAILTILEAVLGWLVHAGWQAAVLALLVLLLGGVLRQRLEPRWRFCLWVLVLARLAMPLAPPAPWGLFRPAPPSRPSVGPVEPDGTFIAEPGPTIDGSGGTSVTGPSSEGGNEGSQPLPTPAE